MIFCRNVDCIRSSSTTSSKLPENSHGATTQKWIKNISASMFLIQNLTFFSLSLITNHLLMGYKIILKKVVLELGKKIKIVACHDSYDPLENKFLYKWEKYQFVCITIFQIWLFLSNLEKIERNNIISHLYGNLFSRWLT